MDSNTLWQGFGGPCESTNSGDPVVLYDHLADRWMMSQFALPNGFRGPFYQCIAVSQTPDPTLAWHRYEFLISQNKLNDYPKFGVWPDAYYMSINQYACNPARCNWGGQGVIAFERDQMLNGGAARMVYFDLESMDTNLGGMLPADLDGPMPPTGVPNSFVQVDDASWGYSGQDQLQIWNFHVDWNNPTSSTFTFDRSLATAAFDANMCGYSRNCVPQPGGTNVDAISDRLMFRQQYRNFGTYQTIVVNHTVDADGSDHAGIRWYELRNDGSGWDIYQQGTYAPDVDHRWMGSIAMNGAGDIALGYSVSSGITYPSIRFTGRLAGDSVGQMTQGEGEIIAGSGYQSHISGRWGDYSMMSVDPVDDCTFWYTQEYYASVGNAPWRTRIGSFKLSECGPVDKPPTVSIDDPVEGQTVNSTYRVLVGADDDNTVSTVELSVDGGNFIDITNNYDGTHYNYDWNTTTLPEGQHTLQARATDDATQDGLSELVFVLVDNSNDPPVADAGPDLTVVDSDGNGSETVTLDAIAGPIAFDAASSAHTDPNSNTLSWNHTTSGADRIMIVGVTTRSNTPVSSISYGGVNLTKIRHDNPGIDVRTELWYLIDPQVGTHSVDLTVNSSTTIEAGATTWTGVGQTAVDALGANAGTSGTNTTTASVDIASTSGEVVVDVVGTQHANATVTAGGGQTERWNEIGTAGVGAASSEPGATTVTMSWNLAIQESWAISAVALLPSGGSFDPDGTIVSYEWDTDDDGITDDTGEAVMTSFDVGTHTVTLTVTDDDGVSDSDTMIVTVEAISSEHITLTAIGYRVMGLQKADLTWSGATSTYVEVYRDGELIATPANADGSYTDNIDQRGGGSYTYQVCEAGTSSCSNEATVSF